MIIEFELLGSRGLHKGVFDSTGFWARFEPEMDLDKVNGYKIFSHFSFAFYHEDERVAREIYHALLESLAGVDYHHHELGFIREII